MFISPQKLVARKSPPTTRVKNDNKNHTEYFFYYKVYKSRQIFFYNKYITDQKTLKRWHIPIKCLYHLSEIRSNKLPVSHLHISTLILKIDALQELLPFKGGQKVSPLMNSSMKTTYIYIYIIFQHLFKI